MSMHNGFALSNEERHLVAHAKVDRVFADQLVRYPSLDWLVRILTSCECFFQALRSKYGITEEMVKYDPVSEKYAGVNNADS